jgi:hypothetical protein
MRTDKCYINATSCKRTTLGRPPQTVLENPCVKPVLLLLGKTKSGCGDAL